MFNHKKIAVILLAAGMGKRMQAGVNKAWLKLENRSIISRSLQAFQNHPAVDLIVLVAPENEMNRFADFLDEQKQDFRIPVHLAAGGKERQHSVANGLNYLNTCPEFKTTPDLVLIHDAARALITAEVIDRSIAAADQYRAAAVGVPVKDTIKVITSDGWVSATPERSTLWAIQTPQAFEYRLIFECYQAVTGLDKLFSDDCSVVEYCGHSVKLVLGSYENIKITTPEDLTVAESILRRRADANRSRI